MAEFRRAVLTNKGLALLAKAQSDHIPISITEVVSGSGAYTDEEDLMGRTALKEPKQTFAPTSIKRQNETNVYVRFSITNNPPAGPLLHGYTVREVGLIASDPLEGDILYAIAVTAEGQGDYLPAYNDLMPTVIGVNFMIEVANADTVIIDTEVSAYVTNLEIEERAIYWNGEEEMTTTFNQDGSITETTGEGDKVTEFNQDGSITETYPDGRVLITTFNQDGSISRALFHPTPPVEEESESLSEEVES